MVWPACHELRVIVPNGELPHKWCLVYSFLSNSLFIHTSLQQFYEVQHYKEAIYIHIHHFINLHYVKPRYSQLVPLSNIWWIYHWITTYLTATPWYLLPEYSYLLWLFQESWCMSMKIKLINSSLFRKLGIFSQNSSSTSSSTSRLKRLFQHISMGCCWTGTEDSFVKWCPQCFLFLMIYHPFIKF